MTPRPPATIALVFDFDDTLAPDSTSKVLEAVGIDASDFWDRHVELLKNGWDQVPAYMHMMLEESRSRGGAITRDLIENVGRDLTFFPGVKTMFKRYKQLIESDHGLRAQFYVVSSGLAGLVRATPIAPRFNDIWGSDFAYDDAGAICAIKNAISFSDKTRYLFQISKGQIGPEFRSKPFAVNERTHEFPVPLRNMVYVGDGYTDIPCFALVQRKGGRAIAAYDKENKKKTGRVYGFVEDRRVTQIAKVDYTKGRGADDAITLAITHIKSRILEEGA
jgi:phosphoserine phosphatase